MEGAKHVHLLDEHCNTDLVSYNAHFSPATPFPRSVSSDETDSLAVPKIQCGCFLDNWFRPYLIRYTNSSFCLFALLLGRLANMLRQD